MSLSEFSNGKIPFCAAEDISDEILRSAIRFCYQSGYAQNTMMLTFFWSAFLYAVQPEAEEHRFGEDVMPCYAASLRRAFPDFSDSEKGEKMLESYWKNVSKNFSALNTEAGISSLLQTADKLNSLNPAGEDNAVKGNGQEAFARISEELRSYVEQILNKHRSELPPEANESSDDLKAVQVAINQNNVNAQIPHLVEEPPREDKRIGMLWYKFLIYVALILGPIINIISSITYFTGAVYAIETNGEVTADIVYSLLPIMRPINIVFGVFLIAFAILAIAVREKLVDFSPDAPKFVYIYYGVSIVGPLLYDIVCGLIIGTFDTVNIVISVVVGALFLYANFVYFEKRAHLFVNKPILPSQTASAPSSHAGSLPAVSSAPTAKAETETKKILFCRRCGAKLPDNSMFCPKCGTKIL